MRISSSCQQDTFGDAVTSESVMYALGCWPSKLCVPGVAKLATLLRAPSEFSSPGKDAFPSCTGEGWAGLLEGTIKQTIQVWVLAMTSIDACGF